MQMDVYDLGKIQERHEFGGTVKIVVGDEAPSNLMSGVFSLAAGEALNPDLHTSDEVFYVIRGELTVRDDADGSVITVPQGAFARIPRGVVHISSNQGSEAVEVVWTFARPE